MARNISGSIRNVSLSGTPYKVAADSNVTMPSSAFENENVPTSGSNMRKMMRRSQTVESVVIIANSAEHAQIQAFSEGLDDIDLAVTNAAGDVYRALGAVHVESYESEENRLTVSLLPIDAWNLSEEEV